MSAELPEPRTIRPMQKHHDPKSGFKDFSPRVVHIADDQAANEVEEVITPAPKEESAQESVTSSASESQTVQQGSETPVLHEPVTPTEKLEAAVKESGKDSDGSEEEPQTPTPPTPAPAPSLPSSSTVTSPGKSTPPAQAKPPTDA